MIIEHGKRVKKIYFLLDGELFAYDKNGEVIYCLEESTLFGDWECINKIISDVTIKASPKRSAYGFVLEEEDFIKIAKDEIVSAKQFFTKSFYKKQKQIEWLNDDKINYQEMSLECSESEINNSNMFELNEVNVKKEITIEKKIEILKKNISNLEFSLINLKNMLLEKL